MVRRVLWLILVLLLVATGVGSGWLYYGWQALPPSPRESLALAADESPPDIRFRITLPVPEAAAAEIKPVLAGTAQTAQTTQTPQPPASVSGRIESPAGPTAPPQTTAPAAQPAAPPAAPESKAEPGPPQPAEPAQKPDQPPALPPRVEAAKPQPEDPLASLRQPVVVQGITVPPPEVVPPFAPGEKPVLMLETERKDGVINVRGTTNLAVEGNGVQVSLFRVFRENQDKQEKRAELARRGLSLWFEGRFPVRDEDWFKSWSERAKAFPNIFPRIASLDDERVFVEVLFTAGKADLGPVPGLTVHPIPGTDKQVYRIIRPVALPLPPQAQALLAQAKEGRLEEAKPAAPGPPAPPGKTAIEILPLKWLSGPRPGPSAARSETLVDLS